MTLLPPVAGPMSFINVVVISVHLNLMVRNVFEDDHGSEYLQRN